MVDKPTKKDTVKKPKKATKSSDNITASEQIDRKIEDLGDWRGEILVEIRKLIHEVDPEVIEDCKWKGAPVWSHEGMFALANAFKGKVKLTFQHGAQLADPKKLFNAGLEGNKWRTIDFHEGDTINSEALKELIREAINYNTSHSRK